MEHNFVSPDGKWLAITANCPDLKIGDTLKIDGILYDTVDKYFDLNRNRMEYTIIKVVGGDKE